MPTPPHLEGAEAAFRNDDEKLAWKLVDGLADPDEANCPTTIDLRLRLITRFERFDHPQAQQWADLLYFADGEEFRVTLGEYYWHRAAWLLNQGERMAAATAVREASRAYPALRVQMLDDSRLSEFFG